MQLTFLGAAGTVTGSQTLLEQDGKRILVDCGMYQGVKAHRLRNRRPWPFDPAALDAVVLTHAHTDHSALLPRLVKEGFRGKIHCTPPTADLCEILLPDSGRIQEEDARYLNKKKLSKHDPAKPLYTEDDARRVMGHLAAHGFDDEFTVGPFHVRFKPAGHILGAASAMIETTVGTLCVSGDLGRPGMLLMDPPEPFEGADWLIMESTYGDRRHAEADAVSELEAVVARAHGRGAVLLIPAFAVGRVQAILAALHKIFAARPELSMPVHIDSPMATNVSKLYIKHADYHRLALDQIATVFGTANFVRSVDESKELNGATGPVVIIASSGMISGGRILHHLKAHAGDDNNIICLSGYQAPGTRGADIENGVPEVKIHGRYVPIRAEVAQLDTFSAHADQQELIDWVNSARRKPREVFLVHGEPVAADVLRRRVHEEIGCPVYTPEYRDCVTLQ